MTAPESFFEDFFASFQVLPSPDLDQHEQLQILFGDDAGIEELRACSTCPAISLLLDFAIASRSLTAIGTAARNWFEGCPPQPRESTSAAMAAPTSEADAHHAHFPLAMHLSM